MIYRILSRYPKKLRDGDGPVKLWHVDWFVFDNKTKIYLACPTLDEKRLIYVIWDNVQRKVLYTSSDLENMVKQKMDMDKVDWRELKENHPYFRNGVWYSFVGHVPITERHFIMKKYLGNGEIPYLVIVNDRNKRFVAQLKNDWTLGFINEAQKKKTNPNAWRDILPLPAYLEWGVYVPETPGSLLFDGKADPRLARIEDMDGVVFLLDRAVKQLLYWNSSLLTWLPYELRDPGWGIFAGTSWRRKNVVYSYDMQMFTWRDSITYKNYGLVKGDDYEKCSQIFKVLRTQMLDAFAACLEAPGLLFELDVSTIDFEIEDYNAKILKIKKSIQDRENEIQTIGGASQGTVFYNRSSQDNMATRRQVLLGSMEGFLRKYNSMDNFDQLKKMLNDCEKIYIQKKETERDQSEYEQYTAHESAFEKKTKEILKLFGNVIVDDISKIEMLLNQYCVISYQIYIQPKNKQTDSTAAIHISVDNLKRDLQIEQEGLEKALEKQKRARGVSDKLERERQERDQLRNTRSVELRERIDTLIDGIDRLKRENDTKNALILDIMEYLKQNSQAITDSCSQIKQLFEEVNDFNTNKDFRKNLHLFGRCEQGRLLLNLELAVLIGSPESLLKISDIDPDTIKFLNDVGVTFNVGADPGRRREEAAEGMRRIDAKAMDLLSKTKRLSPKKVTVLFERLVDEVFNLIKISYARKHDVAIEKKMIDVISEKIKSDEDKLHQLHEEISGLYTMPGEVPLNGENDSVIIEKREFIREINKMMKNFSSMQAAMCRYQKYGNGFKVNTKIGNFIYKDAETLNGIKKKYENNVHPLIDRLFEMAKTAKDKIHAMQDFLNSILPSAVKNRNKDDLDEYMKRKSAKREKMEERKQKRKDEKVRRQEKLSERTEALEQLRKQEIDENKKHKMEEEMLAMWTEEDQRLDKRRNDSDESNESDLEVDKEDDDFNQRFDCYGLPDYYIHCQVFRWEPINELPFVLHGLREIGRVPDKMDGEGGGSVKRLRWELRPIDSSYLGKTGKSGKKKKGKKSETVQEDEVRLIQYENTPLEQVEEPYVYDISDSGVPESVASATASNIPGEYPDSGSRTAQLDDNHDESELNFEPIRLLPRYAAPEVTHRVTRTPPLYIKKTSKDVKVTYFYTDYSDWVTYSLDNDDVYTTPPPWKPVGTPMSHAINVFKKKYDRKSEYQKKIDEAYEAGKTKRDTILCRKVCTGPSFFMPGSDVNQKIALLGAPLYPITDWHARTLGFIVVHKNSIMSSENWDELIEQRIRDARFKELHDYAKSKGVDVKTSLGSSFFLGVKGGGDSDSEVEQEESSAKQQNTGKIMEPSNVSHKGVNGRNVKGRREKRDAQNESTPFDRAGRTDQKHNSKKSGRSGKEVSLVTNRGAQAKEDSDSDGDGMQKRGGVSNGVSNNGNTTKKKKADSKRKTSSDQKSASSNSISNDSVKKNKDYFDIKYGGCPGGFPPGDWYHLLLEKEKNEDSFGHIFEPKESDVFKYERVDAEMDSTQWMDRGDQMVLINHRKGTVGYSLVECLSAFCEHNNKLGVGRSMRPDDAVNFYEERLSAIKTIQKHVMETSMKIRNLKQELAELERLNLDAEQNKVRLDGRKVSRKKAVEKLNLELDYYLNIKSDHPDESQVISIRHKNNQYKFNMPADVQLRKSELMKEIESLFAEDGHDIDMLRNIDSGVEDRNTRIQTLIDSIRSAEDNQIDYDSMEDQVGKEINVIKSNRKMSFDSFHSFRDKIRGFAKSVDSDGVDSVSDWLVRLNTKTDDSHPFEESWLDAMMVSLETSIPITVLDLDRDSGTASEMYEFRCDDPVYPPEVVMYVVESDTEHTYSLALSRKSYVLLKLLQYYRDPDNQQWIKERKSRSKKTVAKKESNEGQKVIVMDALGNLTFDKLGAVPISSLIVHEQPMDNYSFFSMCRDAMAAHLNLHGDDIAPTIDFRRDWIDYLCYLPDEACNMAIGNMRISIPGKTRTVVNMREHIKNTVGDYFFRTMQEGGDFVLNDEQLHIISEVGAPVSACNLNAKNLKNDYYSFRVIPCYEQDNELRIRFVMQPKNDKCITVPFLIWVAYNVGEDGTNHNAIRGDPSAHYYHLLCAPDVEYEARNIEEKRVVKDSGSGGAKKSLSACGYTNLYDYDHFGIQDHYEVERLGMVPYDMCQDSSTTHILNGMNSSINLGVSPGQATNNNALIIHSDKALVTSRSGGDSLVVRGSDGRMLLVDNSMGTVGVDGVKNNTHSQGAVLVVDQASRLLDPILKNAKSTQIVSKSVTVLESEKRSMYITDYKGFPKIRYFNQLPSYVYPGVNHIYLPDISKEASVDDGLMDRRISLDTVNTKISSKIGSMVLHIESGDARSFTFNEIRDRMRVTKQKLPPKLVSATDFEGLFDYFWNYIAEHDKLPPTKFIISRSVPDVSLLSRQAYEAEFVKYLVERERVRVNAWNSRTEEDLFMGHDDYKEPLSDLYLNNGVYTIPSNSEFESQYKNAFTVEYAKLVKEWVNRAIIFYREKINETKTDSKYKKKPKTNFVQYGYFEFIVACTEAQWIDYMSERTVDTMLSEFSVKETPMTWKSRKPTDQDKHAIPDFMTARLTAPRNTAIAQYIPNHGFEIKSEKIKNLIDIIGQTSFNKVNIGHAIVGNHPFKDYQEDFLHRVATEHSLMSITTQLEMHLDPGLDKRSLVKVHAPLTMDTLRVLSRTYCSIDEDKRESFLYRDSPTVNFVVVERMEDASPLPGQLKVVLASDPRGLALAFGMMQPGNLAKLPTEKDYTGIGEDKKFDFRFVSKLRDAHCLSKILFILRIPADFLKGRIEDEFYCLTRVQPCRMGSEYTDNRAHEIKTDEIKMEAEVSGKFDHNFSSGDVLAGVRFSMDKLVSVCDEFARSQPLPVRPYPHESISKKFDPNKKSVWHLTDDTNQGGANALANDLDGFRKEVLRMEKDYIGLGKLRNSTRGILNTETDNENAVKAELDDLKRTFDEKVKANRFFATTQEADQLNELVGKKQAKLASLEKKVRKISETLHSTETEMEKVNESIKRARDTLMRMEEVDAENKRLKIEDIQENRKTKQQEKEKKRTDMIHSKKVLGKVHVIEEKNDMALIIEAKSLLGDYTMELEKKEIELSYLHMTEKKDPKAVISRKQKLKFMIGRLSEDMYALGYMTTELEEKNKELEEALDDKDSRESDITDLKGYITTLKQNIELSQQAIKRLNLEILQHKLFDTKALISIAEKQRMDDKGQKISQEQAMSLIKMYNERIDEYNRDIQAIGEVKNTDTASEFQVDDKEYKEKQLLQQITELTRKIADVKAEIEKLELKKQENTQSRAVVMEKHSKLNLEEERRRLYSEMKARIKFINEKNLLEEEIKTMENNSTKNKKEKSALTKKKDNLTKKETQIKNIENSIKVHRKKIAEYLDITDEAKNLVKIMGKKYSSMKLDNRLFLYKETAYHLGVGFWEDDVNENKSDHDSGDWNDDEEITEETYNQAVNDKERERITEQAVLEQEKGFIEYELQRGAVYSVRKSDRELGILPRVCFLAYSVDLSFRVPRAARTEMFPALTNMEAFASKNELRVYVFVKEGDEIAFSYCHDFRKNIMKLNHVENTAYFLLSGSCIFTLVPSVADIVSNGYDHDEEVHSAYTKYINALYERVKLGIKIIHAVGTLSKAIGLNFKSESIKIKTTTGGEIDVGVSHGSDITLWKDRLDSELQPPKTSFPLKTAYNESDDSKKRVEKILKLLDVYADQLCTFYSLAKAAFTPVLKELLLYDENAVNEENKLKRQPSILDEYLSRATRMSFLCNFDFHYDARLHSVYERFRSRLRNFHGTFRHASDIGDEGNVHGLYYTGDESDLIKNNAHLYSLAAPVTHSKRLEGLLLSTRRRGLLHKALVDSILVRLLTHSVIASNFREPQGKLARMVTDNVVARYFVEIKVASRAPQKFKNHVRMRLTESVDTFMNPFDHCFYKIDREAMKVSEIDIQMPFWDKRIQTMCVIDHHDQFMRLFRNNSDIDKILKIMPSDENDENYDSSREDLLHEKEGVLNAMREHQRLHLYAWNGRAFVHYNKISVKELEKRVDDVASKRDSYMEKIALAEHEYDDAKLKLDTLKSDAVVYKMIGMVSGHWSPNLKKTPSLSGMELLVRQAGDRVYQARQEFARYEEELNTIQDLYNTLSSNPMNQDLELKDLQGEFTDSGRLSFTWKSSTNNVMYVLDLSGEGLNTMSMWHVFSGVSSWMIKGVFPVWNEATQTFNTDENFKSDDVWLDPRTMKYMFLDSFRRLHFFEKSSMRWKQYERYQVQSIYMEVKSITPLDNLASQLSRITCINEGGFRLEILPNSSERSDSKTKYSTELTWTNFEPTGDSINMFEIRIATVRMDCRTPSEWKTYNALEARFVSLLEKNKNERSNDRNEFWKVQQYKISHGDVENVGGWHESMYMPESSGESHLPCDFDAHRYTTVCGGNPNDVAVDFGSSGHSPAWEHPIVVFRESYFVCNSDGKIMVIPRKPLHHGSTHETVEEALNSGHIITNPTGIFAQNVERYWGYRPDHEAIKAAEGYHSRRTRLAITTKKIRVKDPEMGVIVKIVPDMKKLFGERVSVIHEWMHSPRNWYWDKDLGEFVVFAFAPDMVQVHRDGKIPCLVQEMVEYRVGRFYTDEFRLSLLAFLRDRKLLSGRWMEMMGRGINKISKDLRDRVDNPEYKINGYPDALCREVKEWTDGIMKCISNDTKFDDYKKYYNRLGGYVMDPFNYTPVSHVRLPKNEIDLIRIMGERQIGIRRRFWKLFRQKFGCSYHTFLTDIDTRKKILSVSPEPLGPYAAVFNIDTEDTASAKSEDRSKEGKNFIELWVERLVSNPAASFKDFFDEFTFSDQKVDSDGSINGLKSDEFPLRFHEFDENSDTNDVDDPVLEDWYWEQASVRLAGHG